MIMTEEQIKQNADNYTESLMCENLHRTMYSSIDFIAGAHSRDEEIEELRKYGALENKMRIDLINECEQLKQELDQLRNPWRDAKKELPEKINKFYSDFVFVAYSVKGEFRFGIDRYDFEREEFSSHVHAEYWMSIPETPKGE